jgi:hypothetical protein
MAENTVIITSLFPDVPDPHRHDSICEMPAAVQDRETYSGTGPLRSICSNTAGLPEPGRRVPRPDHGAGSVSASQGRGFRGA